MVGKQMNERTRNTNHNLLSLTSLSMAIKEHGARRRRRKKRERKSLPISSCSRLFQPKAPKLTVSFGGPLVFAPKTLQLKLKLKLALSAIAFFYFAPLKFP